MWGLLFLNQVVSLVQPQFKHPPSPCSPGARTLLVPLLCLWLLLHLTPASDCGGNFNTSLFSLCLLT